MIKQLVNGPCKLLTDLISQNDVPNRRGLVGPGGRHARVSVNLSTCKVERVHNAGQD